MATNAQRQAEFKARMREEGKKQLTVWATPEQEQAIKAFLAGKGLLPVTQLDEDQADAEHLRQVIADAKAEPASQLPAEKPETQPLPVAPKVKLKKADPRFLVIPGEYAVSVDTAYMAYCNGEYVGIVWRSVHGPTYWYAMRRREGSVLDALSKPRSYRTRQQATNYVVGLAAIANR